MNPETKEFIASLLSDKVSDEVLAEMLELKRTDWEQIIILAQQIKAGDSDIPESFGTHQVHDIG